PPIIVATVQDITERSKWEEKLLYQANFDQLTGLVNRHYMQSHISSAFNRARRRKQKVGLLFIDLDNFKTVNDTLGHDIGDEVLKQTANRILSVLRESDTPARSGGDEFTVLLEGLEQAHHVEIVARKLVRLFNKPIQVESREIYTTVSIGISIFPNDGQTVDQLMQYADMAMYHAKEDGRNTYRFFSNEMCHSSEERMLMANHLRHALDNDELSLAFQPKIDITNGRIVGAEALLRWSSPELGPISPNKFIPLAEEMGFIEKIGTWVLEASCREARKWQELSAKKLHVAVNISPQQFRAGTLLDAVDQALKISGLPPEWLELEITESLLLQDTHKPIEILNALHQRNICLALDDFGTGYSSLSYLKQFPLQVLKIDRSFIHDLVDDKNDRTLVQAIIAMAYSLNLEIVAEGVENKQQLEFLQQCGIEIVQGFLFSPPVRADEFRKMLLVDAEKKSGTTKLSMVINNK
ncbi:MAG: EAL domain-containing protein, partial [Xanthomonadaceae bacterium]|nr:EAL domain-containing protein [Xanthomonadaceae bacterium]